MLQPEPTMTRERKLTIPIVAGIIVTTIIGLVGNILTGTPTVTKWIEAQQGHLFRTLAIAIALLVAVAILIALWQNRIQESKAAASAGQPLSEDFRRKFLARVLRDRVTPRIEQGLRKAVRIHNSLTLVPSVVQPKLRVYAEVESGPQPETPTDQPIADLFEQTASGRLLILGDPGTGKTNLLLELADSLIHKAEADPTRSLPVVFSLPRWTLGKQVRKLEEWLADDLTSEYGVSPATASGLVANNQLTPLLDGLDEVAEHQRNACVEAINTFQREHDLSQLVVCCRTKEYSETIQLELESAVRIERLTRTRIEYELQKPNMETVALALRNDPQLWAIVDTPLWLHVLFGAAQVDRPASDDSSDPRQRLYARYVEYALSRDPDGYPRKLTSREDLLARLRWLAMAMQERNQSQFSFEDLTASWLQSGIANRWKRLSVLLVYLFAFELTFGVYFALLWKATAVPGASFWIANIAGFAVCLGSIFSSSRRPTEGITFVWTANWRTTAFNLGSGIFWAALAWYRFRSWRPVLILFFAVSLGSLAFDCVRTKQLSERSDPNSGTMRSLHLSLALLAASASFAVIHILLSHSSSAFLVTLNMAVFMLAQFSAIIAFYWAGDFVVENYATRVLLWMGHKLPLRSIHFFNEAAARLFLIQRGGSYEFIHPTFRDYFAELHNPQIQSPEMRVPHP